MKISEIMINFPLQVKKPQSPGARGMKLSKVSPGKKYYDTVRAKLKQLDDNLQ